jgi:hypothetical protein
MGLNLLPFFLRDFYEAYEWNNACAILKMDYPREFNDINDLLENFRLEKSWIVKPGGRKSPISDFIDSFLYKRGWKESAFNIKIEVDDQIKKTATHKIDCYKNEVGVEIEWNNKDPFFDRDLANFRLLFELQAIRVGVIITRSDSLQDIFNELGKGASYGSSTTHMGKLIPRINSGVGGGCPFLVFGITKRLYIADI